MQSIVWYNLAIEIQPEGYCYLSPDVIARCISGVVGMVNNKLEMD